MAREKTPAPFTETADTDHETAAPLTETADTDHETAAGIAPSAIPVADTSIAPTRTRDRDPADREAWKRERARQLGHHR